MQLHHELQDCIEDGSIHLDGIKQNTDKSVAKENSELQIYTDPFPSHSANMIIDPTNFASQLEAYVNMVTVTSTVSPAPGLPDITFTTQDLPLNNKPSPLYILARINGNIVTRVLIDPTICVNVINEETLVLKSLQKEKYEDTRSTIRTHIGMNLKPYGLITLSVLVGPRIIDTVFDVIPESGLFRVKLGIPWLASMNGVASVIHKCLKFSHKGVVHVVHDIGYQPLVSRGGYSLDHFWPSSVGPLPSRIDLLHKNYMKYKTGGKGKPKLTLPVTKQLVTSSSRQEKKKPALMTTPSPGEKEKSTPVPSTSREGKEKVTPSIPSSFRKGKGKMTLSRIAPSSPLSWEEY